MINNECIKGEEDLLWFQNPTLLICGFYNPLSGILSSTIYNIVLFQLKIGPDHEAFCLGKYIYLN